MNTLVTLVERSTVFPPARYGIDRYHALLGKSNSVAGPNVGVQRSGSCLLVAPKKPPTFGAELQWFSSILSSKLIQSLTECIDVVLGSYDCEPESKGRISPTSIPTAARGIRLDEIRERHPHFDLSFAEFF
jgi:hypothetical protein